MVLCHSMNAGSVVGMLWGHSHPTLCKRICFCTHRQWGYKNFGCTCCNWMIWWNFQYQIFVNKYWYFPNFQLVHQGKWFKNQLVLQQNLLIIDEWMGVKIFTGHTCYMFPWDLHLVQYLLTSWQPAWQPSHSLPCTCEQVLVGLKTHIQIIIKLIKIIIRFLCLSELLTLNMHIAYLECLTCILSECTTVNCCWAFPNDFAHLIVIGCRCAGNVDLRFPGLQKNYS